jgi:alpha-L-rhamnosidase
MSRILFTPWTKFALSVGVGMVALTCGARSAPTATHLRCEYHQNPTAIGSSQPRLSWIVEPAREERGVVQTAYRVLVARDLSQLARDEGDLWDSGRISSDQTVHVVYDGKPLESGQACYWKVKLWDGTGRESAWSEPARWGMGLLKPSDWMARWIGYDTASEKNDAAFTAMQKLLQIEGQSWVWVNGAKPGNQPAGNAYFRKVIQLPADRVVKQAIFLLTADDGFQLFINGHPAGQGATWRSLVSVEVTGRLQAGANALGIEVTNGGDNPSPAGVIGRFVVAFTSGEPMIVPLDSSWQTSLVTAERWNWPDFDPNAWKPASPVGQFGDQPWGRIDRDAVVMEPAPFFRKAFTVGKPVKRAMLYASALGVYELRLNGQPVDTDALSPGWTDYRKRVHYFGYDVTPRLRQGENVVGAILGDGWYAGYLAFSGRRHYYGDQTRLLVQMQVEYADGSMEILGSDGTWKATTGPILQNDLLMGCIYDARREMPGWDAPGYSDAQWRWATVDESVQANLQPHPGTPIRPMEEVTARKLSEPKPGVYVFDLGQNIVGWVRLKAKGDPGQEVVVRHAEMLNPDGTLYTVNLRAAKATDTFYLAGAEKRAYEPAFTFHGFQYVEVTGLNYRPELPDVTGVVVYSDLPQAGAFECSEPLVNKLVLNSLWGQKGNFLDVPTDCPQRDERAGWTGDAQVFMKTACLNLDSPAFYTKWLVDLCQDSQRADGGFGDVAPHVSIVSYGNTGWTDAGPVCNWRMYEMYGDTRVLAEHYDALLRHVEYLANTSQDHVRGTGAYGDWLRLAGPQHSEAIGTAYYFYAARLMTGIAEVLGKQGDAARFRQLSEEIRTVFVSRFIKADGQIVDAKNETGQTFYALAFGLDLVPTEMKAKVAAHFLGSIRKQDDHLATGFLGTPFVLAALQKAGHPEVAYALVLNKTYPSWLQQVIWGSTTMWERWDGWRPDKGFQDPGMNSFNHYWLGCVSEWLFTQAAGIDTDGPGFQRMVIRPEIVTGEGGLNWVKASYRSIRGEIRSAWKRSDGRFDLEVTVPGNCRATVYVPAQTAATVTEGGMPAKDADGVRFLRLEGGKAVFEVGSGHYTFQSAL